MQASMNPDDHNSSDIETGAGARILVVEDEAIIGMEIVQRLRRNGLDVVGLAKSGEEAYDMAAAHRPDLVLMDIILKGDINGIEAAERIIAAFDLPVVFLTANADRKTINRAKQAGPFGYLVKPFQERELLTTLEIALYKHRLERELREAKERAERALAEVRQLRGLLPICSYCKKIRDDANCWHQLEQYISHRTDASFSHGICPSCYEQQVSRHLRSDKDGK
ncbi:MAG: response regulator [Myxococcales bacterium]|nr:response regulator [Myxococcales bacterium]